MEYILQHWYIIPIFALLIGLTVFMWIKAIVSGQKRKEERDRIIAELEKEKSLRNQFKVINEATFCDSSISDERLISGICMNIQMYLEKLDNMNEEFLCLHTVKKNIYALNFVFEDSKFTSLCEFFRSNGEPLLSQGNEAVKTVIGGEFARIFSAEFDMFDENSEVSYNEKELNILEQEFNVLMDNEKAAVISKTAAYIRENNQELMS